VNKITVYLKIAWRNLRKDGQFSVLNLARAFAARRNPVEALRSE
jgi:hypothetical protein